MANTENKCVFCLIKELHIFSEPGDLVEGVVKDFEGFCPVFLSASCSDVLLGRCLAGIQEDSCYENMDLPYELFLYGLSNGCVLRCL